MNDDRCQVADERTVLQLHLGRESCDRPPLIRLVAVEALEAEELHEDEEDGVERLAQESDWTREQ